MNLFLIQKTLSVFVLGRILLRRRCCLQSVLGSVCRFQSSAINRKTSAKFPTKPSNLSLLSTSAQFCLFLPLRLRRMHSSDSTFECHFIKFLKQPACTPRLTCVCGGVQMVHQCIMYLIKKKKISPRIYIFSLLCLGASINVKSLTAPEHTSL